MLFTRKLRPLVNGGTTWSVFWVTMTKRRNSNTFLPRAALRVDPNVEKRLAEMEFKHRKHPGKLAGKTTQLPARLVDAAKIALQEYPIDQFKAEAKSLSQYLFSRHSPLEKDEIMDKTKKIERRIIEKDPQFSQEPVSEEDQKLLELKLRNKITHRLHTLTYHWKPINYDKTKGLVYLLARSAPEYAVLTTIFTELRLRNESFQPQAVLDFGSGIGTTFWASYGLWGKSMKEYFAVDTSGDMNDLAQLLVQDGSAGNSPILQGTFFRQFLPASHLLSYDLVVSAYSLMELPSRELRLQTLENLWSKTNEFLVIVEQGTNAGHKLILEARDFLLKTSAHDVHVFSPCSHDVQCPKQATKIPCNFEARYLPLHGKQENPLVERYSYVVLRKKRRPVGDPWPRIVYPVLNRGRHVVCRMCCSDGQLKETVLTSAKHGKALYRCARGSSWGDLLPAFESEVDPDDEVDPEVDPDDK